MKTFKGFIKEEIVQSANVKSGSVDISDSAVRDNINGIIASATRCRFVTPYVALERVRRTLASYHIFLPGHSFLEGDSGTAMFPVNQFGVKIGQTNDGEVVTTPPSSFTVYFEYNMSDNGMFDVFCEILDQDELKDVISDLEDELNEEHEGHHVHPFMPETGPRHTPGSNQPLIVTGINSPEMLKGENRDKMKSHLERGDAPKDGDSDEDDVHSGLRFAGAETGPKITPGSNQPMAIAARVVKKLNELRLSPEQQMDDKQSKLNELSAELVGKVNKKRLEKPSKTAAANATLTRAVRKKWLESDVGKLKEGRVLPDLSKPEPKGEHSKDYMARVQKKKDKASEKKAAASEYLKMKGSLKEEERVDEAAKWRSTSVAKKITDPDDGEYHQGYHIDNPRSTGMKQATSDTPLKPGSLMTRRKAEVATQGARKGMITKAHANKLKTNIHLNMHKEENLQELSKETLGSYVKKASHDVATKSAAVGRYAERANKEEDNRKKNKDYSGYQQGRKDSAFADKMFKKSWKRREGIAKAVDKLTKEEVIQELSDKLKARYTKKATADKKEAERQAAHSEHAAKHAYGKKNKEGFKKEAEWLKGIAAKRAKGIEMAKKKS
jgi:hypothetical protein